MGLETLPGSASITIMGARPYHPGLGLFLTPDPLIDGGNALYAYTSGDPINYRDPSGGSEESNFGVFLAAIGGGIAAVIAGGTAWGAVRGFTKFGSSALAYIKASTCISGIAGLAATGAGIFVAVKAGADSDQGLMIAGIAIAAAGAGFGLTGVIGGVRNIRKLKAPRGSGISEGVAPVIQEVPGGVAQKPAGWGEYGAISDFNLKYSRIPTAEFGAGDRLQGKTAKYLAKKQRQMNRRLSQIAPSTEVRAYVQQMGREGEALSEQNLFRLAMRIHLA
jgi:hypothetical protein